MKRAIKHLKRLARENREIMIEVREALDEAENTNAPHRWNLTYAYRYLNQRQAKRAHYIYLYGWLLNDLKK